MTTLVEGALHATYQLSPTGSGRLRRLTAASGLTSENILSRVALTTSLADPTPVHLELSATAGKGKEIRGATLLGRPGPASLLIGLIVRHSDREVSNSELRGLILGHWERGLRMINDAAGGGSILDRIAEQLTLQRDVDETGASKHEPSKRDSLAASLGREFGLLPVEVRRLLALVGRFDLGRSRAAAMRLIGEVGSASGRVSEAQAMQVLRSWGLNRLGMTALDSDTMDGIHKHDAGTAVTPTDLDSIEFLANLGLVQVTQSESGDAVAVPSAMAITLGPGSWRQ